MSEIVGEGEGEQERLWSVEEEIIDIVQGLTMGDRYDLAYDLVGQLERFVAGLRSDVKQEQAGGTKPIGGREVAETIKKPGGLTLQLEYVRCGKERCKTCNAGKGHGPYWYGYARIGGKVKSHYIGKDRSKAAQWEAGIDLHPK
jgi:hypothetical protein